MKKQFIVTIEVDINVPCKVSVENALENETVLHCGECKHFLDEDASGYGYCELLNIEQRCSQRCARLYVERKKYQLWKRNRTR